MSPLIRRFSQGGAVGLLVCLLAACAGREEATESTRALAERLYPGELAILSTHRQKANYLVVLGVKGDPVTRIDFLTEADPTKCEQGSRCESRFRMAYDTGKRQGARLKALDQVFGSCGVPIIAMDGRVTPYIELDLRQDNQEAQLDRLTPCATALGTAAAGDATGVVPSTVRLFVLPVPRDGATAPPKPLTFEDQLPGKRLEDLSYSLVMRTDGAPSPSALSLSPRYVQHSGLHKKLAEAARTFLAGQHQDAFVPTTSFATGLKLDLERLDVVRTYILACSRQSEGRCREDMAVSFRYDITADKASDFAVVQDVRDERGSLRLPDLPGR